MAVTCHQLVHVLQSFLRVLPLRHGAPRGSRTAISLLSPPKATVLSLLSPYWCHHPVLAVTPRCNLSVPPVPAITPSATTPSLPSPQVPPPCPCFHPKSHHPVPTVPVKSRCTLPAVTTGCHHLLPATPPKCHRPVPATPPGCHHPAVAVPPPVPLPRPRVPSPCRCDPAASCARVAGGSGAGGDKQPGSG